MAIPWNDDVVEHPSHYTQGKYEVIDVIEDWKLDYHLGNVIKYIARSEHKNQQLLDLYKARWYLSRKIEQLEKASYDPHANTHAELVDPKSTIEVFTNSGGSKENK